MGAVALLLPGAWHAGNAVADETRWSGRGYTRYWDESTNWLSGPPVSGTTRAALDGFDTILRRGNFLAHSVQGTGALEVRGGRLQLDGGPSALGHLDLQGGRVSTAGALTLQSLRWSGGSAGGPGPWTVRGRAVLTDSRAMQLYDLSSLQLMGDTVWEASVPALDARALLIGRDGRFMDRGGTADRWLTGHLIVEGDYIKTGARTTNHYLTNDFENKGRFLVQQGGVNARVNAGSGWTNSGALRLDPGTAYSIDFDRYTSFTQSGTIDIGRGARFELTSWESSFDSAGTWRVAEGGTLTIGAFSMYQPSLTRSSFTGAIENEGTVVLRRTHYRFSGAGEIRGKGWVNVIEGATLDMNNGRAASLGGLRIEGEGGHGEQAQSQVRVDGALTLNGLEWGAGTLATDRDVTIKGRAVLHHGAYRPPHGDSWTHEPLGYEIYDKHLSSDFHFRGGAVWGGDADLIGPGQVFVAAGTLFEERHLPQSAPERAGRLTQIGVTAFHNAGTYVKTRPGTTAVQSSFYNTGAVRSIGAGLLRFEGPLNNIGALEVANGRVEVRGPLAQWASRRQELDLSTEPFLVQTLTGGRYVMKNGTLALRLGNPEGTAAGQILESQASIVLAGPSARLVNTWSGVDENALIGLRYNRGELRVLEGAVLEIGRSLANQGTLEVGAGSELHFLNSDYVQADEAASTWIGGALRSTRFSLADGTFGAGGDGEVGQARLLGGLATFTGGVLDVDVAGLTDFDRVQVEGNALITAARLWAEFGPAQPVFGTYRILSVSGRRTGEFSEVGSNLDPTLYAVSAHYGPGFVDLTVSAAGVVPEPESTVLMVLGLSGLAGLAARRSRSAAQRQRLRPQATDACRCWVSVGALQPATGAPAIISIWPNQHATYG